MKKDKDVQIVNNGEPDEVYVVEKAKLKCTLGMTESKLMIPIGHGVYIKGKKQANIGDHIPMMNIFPFGNCKKSSPPIPCTPCIPMEWIKGKADMVVDNKQALMNNSFCTCTFGGVIKITDDGQ